MNGLKQGGLSFQIPGLEAPTEGTWVAVDRSSSDEIVETAFEQLYEIVSQQRSPPALDALVASLAKAV